MIGVVGGGQLAQMLVKAGNKRSVKVHVQTASNSDPAARFSDHVVLSDPQDVKGTEKLAKTSTAITFENEWVDIQGLTNLKNQGFSFYPDIEAISPLVDKLSQRILLRELDIPCTEWTPIVLNDNSSFNLPSGWRYPFMAKMARGGYDGKGTRVIRDLEDLHILISEDNVEKWFLEKWVKYEKELSLVVSRDQKGKIRYFPIAETVQSNQVCDWVIAPAEVDHSVEAMAHNMAASLLSDLDYVGVLAIEFFYGKQGLIVNEIAPRTHNSGHFSIEACESSQFDQQLCITARLPVPSPNLRVPGALMVNLLGLSKRNNIPINQRLDLIRALEGSKLHWYEKDREVPGRKLGHVTYLLMDKDASIRQKKAFQFMEKIRAIWPIN